MVPVAIGETALPHHHAPHGSPCVLLGTFDPVEMLASGSRSYVDEGRFICKPRQVIAS
jgi:hypothetical protein